MAIPEGCKDCGNVGRILTRPIKTYGQRIEEKTGLRIVQSGGSIGRSSDLPAEYIGLEDGRKADDRIVERAWREARLEADLRTQEAEDFAEGCPGLCEAQVRVNDTVATMRVCGQTALEALKASQS